MQINTSAINSRDGVFIGRRRPQHFYPMAYLTPSASIRDNQRANRNQRQVERVVLLDQLLDAGISTGDFTSSIEQSQEQTYELSPQFSTDFIDPLPIDQSIVEGIDIDTLVELNISQHDGLQDFYQTIAQMNSVNDEIINGYIAGHHWSEFAESFFGTMDKYLGTATEAYECSTSGMTKAWNAKENQLCEGAGECKDLNNDGHIGDAPTGNNCDGKNIKLTSWLLEKASDAADEALKLLGMDGEDDEEEEEEEECFEKPWEHDQFTFCNDQFQSINQGWNEFSAEGLFGHDQVDFIGSMNNIF